MIWQSCEDWPGKVKERGQLLKLYGSKNRPHEVLRPELCFQVLVRLQPRDVHCASSRDTLGAWEALAAAGIPPSSKASQTHHDFWHAGHNASFLFRGLHGDCTYSWHPLPWNGIAKCALAPLPGQCLADCFNQIRKLCNLVRIAIPTQKWLPWLGKGCSVLH